MGRGGLTRTRVDRSNVDENIGWQTPPSPWRGMNDFLPGQEPLAHALQTAGYVLGKTLDVFLHEGSHILLGIFDERGQVHRIR